MTPCHTSFRACLGIPAALILTVAAAICPFSSVTAQQRGGGASIGSVVQDLNAKLDSSTAEFNQLRQSIEQEQVPMVKQLGELEAELVDVRREYDRVLRIRDTRDLDTSNLRNQIKALEEQNAYLGNLLDDYIRNFESRIHITELQRYRERIEQMRSDVENPKLSQTQQFESKFGVLQMSVDRLKEAAGGAIFEGSAVAVDGVIKQGKFILLGPLAYFASDDGLTAGLVETKLGSIEPSLVNIPEVDMSGVFGLVDRGESVIPLDVTRGNAVKIVEQKETVVDQIRKGGAVMYPLLALAALALLVALIKWIHLSRIQEIGPQRFAKIMRLFSDGKEMAAKREAQRIRGPIGGLLTTAISHANDPQELLEEVMYEKILVAKTSLNRFIPLIGITAAASPLLGLLGTVTGMINTFKLITVFGTGDAQTFSSGISEALITTMWGLIVAIPTLLLNAFLSRKAKAVLDDMEKTAVAFINHLNKGSGDKGDENKPQPEGGEVSSEGVPGDTGKSGARGDAGGMPEPRREREQPAPEHRPAQPQPV